MDEYITLPFEDGTVTVPKGSRIKVYYFGGHIKGFLLGYDGNNMILSVPTPEGLTFDGRIKDGKIRTVPIKNLRGFGFYPEVRILKNKKVKEDD